MFTWEQGCRAPASQCLPHGNDGTTVHAVETGTKTLKGCCGCAFGAWMSDLEAFYVLGSAVGPHYPTIVHEFQRVISGISSADFGQGRPLARLCRCLRRHLWFYPVPSPSM